MDEKMVLQQMAEVNHRLDEINEEAKALRALLRGYERWLRFYSSAEEGLSPPLLDDTYRPYSPVEAMSLRDAVRHVLQSADEPLHCREIWLRVQQLGTVTSARDPAAAIDFTCHTLKGIRKVGYRTWRWVGHATSRDEDVQAAKQLQRLLHDLRS
ncbi:MAG: hypothetical protein HY675_21315 [Chloroflexi bacterium]|nr:hypothetical protein [Chloroflexota bacterium]